MESTLGTAQLAQTKPQTSKQVRREMLHCSSQAMDVTVLRRTTVRRQRTVRQTRLHSMILNRIMLSTVPCPLQ
jgi:hypothetical protein